MMGLLGHNPIMKQGTSVLNSRKQKANLQWQSAHQWFPISVSKVGWPPHFAHNNKQRVRKEKLQRASVLIKE
jgi:hypothetical protein